MCLHTCLCVLEQYKFILRNNVYGEKGSKVSFWFAQKLTFLQLYRGEGGLGDLKIDILHFVSSLTEVLKDCTDI